MTVEVVKQIEPLKITVAFTPQEIKEGIRVYTLQGYFREDEGLAPYPAPATILNDVVNIWRLTDDLALIEYPNRVDVASLRSFSVVYTLNYYQIKTAIGITDTSFGLIGKDLSNQDKAVAVLTDVNYSSWTIRESTGDPAKAISSAILSGRLFLLLPNNNILYSTPSFYNDLLTGADPFDFTRGAGFFALDSANIGSARFLVPYLNALYVLGSPSYSALITIGNISGASFSDMGITVNYFYGGVSIPFDAFGFANNIVAISPDGIFVIRGYTVERLKGIMGYLQNEPIVGGGYFYSAGYKGFVVSNASKSFAYLEDTGQWATYPIVFKKVFTLFSRTFGLTPAGQLMELFPSNSSFLPIWYEAHIPVDATYIRVKDIKIYGQDIGTNLDVGVLDINGAYRTPVLRRADRNYVWFTFPSAVKSNRLYVKLVINNPSNTTRLRSLEVDCYASNVK